MEKCEIIRLIEDVLEIRIIKELISDYREELQNRWKYRRESLLKMDEIIACLEKRNVRTGHKKSRRWSIWKIR